MKKRTVGLLFVGFLSCSAFVWLLLGCLALKRNYEWLAVLIIGGSVFMMLLVHASLVTGAIKDALENKANREEAENRGKGAVEEEGRG
jgi:hypothetical protein